MKAFVVLALLPFVTASSITKKDGTLVLGDQKMPHYLYYGKQKYSSFSAPLVNAFTFFASCDFDKYFGNAPIEGKMLFISAVFWMPQGCMAKAPAILDRFESAKIKGILMSGFFAAHSWWTLRFRYDQIAKFPLSGPRYDSHAGQYTQYSWVMLSLGPVHGPLLSNFNGLPPGKNVLNMSHALVINVENDVNEAADLYFSGGYIFFGYVIWLLISAGLGLSGVLCIRAAKQRKIRPTLVLFTCFLDLLTGWVTFGPFGNGAYACIFSFTSSYMLGNMMGSVCLMALGCLVCTDWILLVLPQLPNVGKYLIIGVAVGAFIGTSYVNIYSTYIYAYVSGIQEPYMSWQINGLRIPLVTFAIIILLSAGFSVFKLLRVNKNAQSTALVHAAKYMSKWAILLAATFFYAFWAQGEAGGRIRDPDPTTIPWTMFFYVFMFHICFRLPCLPAILMYRSLVSSSSSSSFSCSSSSFPFFCSP